MRRCQRAITSPVVGLGARQRNQARGRPRFAPPRARVDADVAGSAVAPRARDHWEARRRVRRQWLGRPAAHGLTGSKAWAQTVQTIGPSARVRGATAGNASRSLWRTARRAGDPVAHAERPRYGAAESARSRCWRVRRWWCPAGYRPRLERKKRPENPSLGQRESQRLSAFLGRAHVRERAFPDVPLRMPLAARIRPRRNSASSRGSRLWCPGVVGGCGMPKTRASNAKATRRARGSSVR
jgi:hypothetical protein